MTGNKKADLRRLFCWAEPTCLIAGLTYVVLAQQQEPWRRQQQERKRLQQRVLELEQLQEQEQQRVLVQQQEFQQAFGRKRSGSGPTEQQQLGRNGSLYFPSLKLKNYTKT